MACVRVLLVQGPAFKAFCAECVDPLILEAMRYFPSLIAPKLRHNLAMLLLAAKEQGFSQVRVLEMADGELNSPADLPPTFAQRPKFMVGEVLRMEGFGEGKVAQAWAHLKESGEYVKAYLVDWKSRGAGWLHLELELEGAEILDFDLSKSEPCSPSISLESWGRAAKVAFQLPEVPTQEALQAALEDNLGEVEAAVLSACGVEPNAENANILRAVQGSNMPAHREESSEASLPRKVEVSAKTEDGKVLEGPLAKAFEEGKVFPSSLGGKDSIELLVADLGDLGSWLVKFDTPNRHPSPCLAGDPVLKSTKEEAFYEASKLFGLESVVPEARAFEVGGKTCALVKMAEGFRPVGKVTFGNPIVAVSLQGKALVGALARWSAMDWTLGSADRHANNMLVDDFGNFLLIDHGRTFANAQFDPPNDSKIFVPFYLRAFAPKGFSKMSPEEKLRYMPQYPEPNTNDAKAASWHLPDPAKLSALLQKFGIDPIPALMRLKDVVKASGWYHNALWVVPKEVNVPTQSLG